MSLLWYTGVALVCLGAMYFGWLIKYEPITGAVIGTTGTGTAANIQTQNNKMVACVIHSNASNRQSYN